MSGFWTWATAHYWLTFFVALSVSKTVRVIFKSVCRIWWAPAPEPRILGPDPPVNNAAAPAPNPTQIRVSRIKPEPPVRRRSMWERIIND